ncbi:MAG: ferrochelatase [Acidobacteria bacterium]|nr:ferrochelatase [Acidobacteriota bacterium]
MGFRRIGVVLFQLGGPDSLEAIEPFLYNLFSDPDIIDFPLARLARQPLARLIAANRAKKVRHHYAEIGGRSPLRELTQRQAEALEGELRRAFDARVVVAMRYWHPLTDEAIRRLEAERVEELVLLPLYPQNSSTTTGSSLKEWERRVKGRRLAGVPAGVIRHFYEHPGYLDAMVEGINNTLSRFAQPGQVRLVFSAHNVPVSVIQAGDPYQQHIEATVRLVRERGGWPLPARLCYQSKVGGARWLEPSLDRTIAELAAGGTKHLLVVPIAFVSDHVETLSEINIAAREKAARCGIEQFEMMPGLNDSPAFIRALAALVEETLGARSLTIAAR